MHASHSTMRASSPTMLARFKSFTLDDGNSCLEFIEPSYALDNQNYMDLHSLLEEGFIVDWPLAFWDHQDKVRIRTRLRKFNIVANCIYAIPTMDASIDCAKRKCVEAFASTFDKPSHTLVDDILDLIDPKEHVPPLASSRVSGDASDLDDVEYMKSIVLTEEILEKYTKVVSKLISELSSITLDNRLWCLNLGIKVMSSFWNYIVSNATMVLGRTTEILAKIQEINLCQLREEPYYV